MAGSAVAAVGAAMGNCACCVTAVASNSSMVDAPQVIALPKWIPPEVLDKKDAKPPEEKLASDEEGRPEWLKKLSETTHFCVKAVHPRSGEFLRARILKDGSEKAVPQIQDIKSRFDKVQFSLKTLIEDPDTKAAISLGMPAISLKWGRFYWHERHGTQPRAC
jgi:hypothetical protein